jgi:hypothetical protein
MATLLSPLIDAGVVPRGAPYGIQPLAPLLHVGSAEHRDANLVVVDMIARALDEGGATSRDDVEALVVARYWGPGRFRAALREAVLEGAPAASRDAHRPAADGGTHRALIERL